MDILNEFENYKKEWCQKHNRPMFKDSQTRIKMAAWKDFIEEFLKPNYAKINSDYKNMIQKTVGDWKKELEEVEQDLEEEFTEPETTEEVVAEVVEEEYEDDSWELVKKLMEEM